MQPAAGPVGAGAKWRRRHRRAPAPTTGPSQRRARRLATRCSPLTRTCRSCCRAWLYQVHLSGAGYDVAGSGYPGTPGLWFGHNDHIAFGITNLVASPRDLYVETLDPTDSTRYREGDTWDAFETRTETIGVRGAADESITIRSTSRGPLVDEIVPIPRGPPEWRAHCPEPPLDRPGSAGRRPGRAGHEPRARLGQLPPGAVGLAAADLQSRLCGRRWAHRLAGHRQHPDPGRWRPDARLSPGQRSCPRLDWLHPI